MDSAASKRWRVRRIAALFLVAGLASACRSDGKFCADFAASTDLNLYAGQPHSVSVLLYPLESSQGFRSASVEELLGGRVPVGALSQGPVEFTVAPGEKHPFTSRFPERSREVGIVVDYYHAPNERPGERKAVVPCKCGSFGKKTVRLGKRDVVAE